MLRELDSVVLRDEPSLRSRILSWFYPNRGWNGAPHYAGAGLAVRTRPSAPEGSRQSSLKAAAAGHER
jgi:hypothetical protein